MEEIKIDFKKVKGDESYSVSMNLGNVTYMYCSKNKELSKDVLKILECVKNGIEQNFELKLKTYDVVNIDMSDIK